MASVCDNYCKGCIYLGKINGNAPCCQYVFMEDKLRPCPAGTGCTVRITNQEAKRRNDEERKAKEIQRMKLQAELREQKHREYLAKKQAEQEEKRKPCKNCGKIFLPNKDHRDHCCDECAYQYHLKTENERSKRRWAERREKANEQKCVSGTAEEARA